VRLIPGDFGFLTLIQSLEGLSPITTISAFLKLGPQASCLHAARSTGLC
jgi:hypothetical protein